MKRSRRVKLLNVEMTTYDIRSLGSSVKMFNGSTYEVIDSKLFNPISKTFIRIDDHKRNIRNVKNSKGQIIAKRTNVGSKLLLTSAALLRSENNASSVSTQNRHFKAAPKAYRPAKSGRAKEVGVLLSDTKMSVDECKEKLLNNGAKQVYFYETKAGTVVVSSPYKVLHDLLG